MALTIPVSEIIENSSNRLLGKHESWGRVLLGDIATVLNGFAFKASEFSNSGGVPLIRIRDVGKEQSETTYLGEYDPRYVVEPGDLLVGMDGDFNCARWRGPRGLLNQRVCKIALKSDLYIPKFLDFTLPGYLKAINDVTSSVTVKHLSSKTIEEIPLPLPPIEIQQRLVAEIEKQFSRLDEAIANLKRVKANLKRYKASVLKAAVEGKLTEEWRRQHPDVEPASQLLERILAERRAKWSGRGKYKEPEAADATALPPLPKDWSWARLEQLGMIVGGLTKNPKRLRFTKKLPYLRVANVYANELRLGEIEHIGVQGSELEKLLLQKGDLLVVEGNGSKDQIGRLAVWDGSIDPCVHQNHLIKVRIVVASQNKWILFWLLSPSGRHFIETVSSSTSGLYTLSVKKVGDLPIIVPSLAEQDQIVAEVERRLSVIDELEAAVAANLTRADRLRQSILGNAFAGKLVADSLREQSA